MQESDHFDELYDRIVKTASCRFAAHDRLKDHHNASLWTITFFSMGLITIPLVQTFGLEISFSQNYVNFIQVVLAIVILVISVLLNMTNFSVRAEKMHQCAMSLNSIARRLHRHINDRSGADEYESFVKEYDDVLQRFDNHSTIDYLYAKNHLSKYYKNSIFFGLYVKSRYFFQFLPYLFLLGVEASWLYLMVSK